MKLLKLLTILTMLLLSTNAYAADAGTKPSLFIDADGAHQGEGGAQLVKEGDDLVLQFVDHFYVTPGPDLYVWLSDAASPKSSSDVKNSQTIELAKLKSPSGKQSYKIPTNIDISQYKSVVIWCKEFGVLFAHAALK